MLTTSLTLSNLPPESESSLQYELKLNEMILVISNVQIYYKQFIQKQSLIECIATLLGLQSAKLHSLICDHLQKCLDSFESLPRKLMYIKKDQSILDDYRKYPSLVNFMKITLEMVSVIFETKITVFYLNPQGVLTGLIINQKAYQSQIKIGRINNYFYEIKESFQSHSHNSLPKLDPSSSSHSYKFYEAFDIQPLPKKIQHKPLDTVLVKSYSHIPGSPLLKKGISFDDRPKNVVMDIQKPIGVVQIPNISALNNKQFDELSLENMAQQQELFSAQQLAQSIKFTSNQALTQSMSLPKQSQNTQPQPQQPQPQPQNQGQSQSPAQIIDQSNLMHSQQQTPSDNTNMFYGYYSQAMYYNSYMMGQNAVRNDYNNFNNAGSASVSPGKNLVRRQNSTLQINENQRYTGRLKFFDEGKNYGFIIMDADESDIFVHCDDLQKAGISKDRVRSYKQSEGLIRFSFKVMSYFGKYKQSRKAVELTILDDGLGISPTFT